MSRDDKADALQREANAAQSLIAELNSDDAQLNHDMVEGETSLFEAIKAALSEIDECDIQVDGCKAKEEQVATRRKRCERRIDTLRGHIEQAMLVADLPHIKTATETVSIARVPPKPIVSDESLIPAIYWKPQPPKLDRTQINKDAKAGEDIPGVTMDNGGTRLTIRRT